MASTSKQYNTAVRGALVDLADGTTAQQVVGAGPVNSAQAAPLNATTTAYAASLVIKATPGNLVGISGYNSKASAQFIQFHDAAALPADTAVPVITFTVAASSNFSLDLSGYTRRFANGIVVCNSSTGPTKTIGSADCWFDAQYV